MLVLFAVVQTETRDMQAKQINLVLMIDGNAIVHNNVFGGGNYGIIGSSNIQGPDVIEFHDETSNFTENKEYLITTSSSGENGLTISGNQLGNQPMSTSAIPSDTSKWIFEREKRKQLLHKKCINQSIYLYKRG